MKHEIRKIIHIDMDAFYASVEQRDFPQYKGKPVIVGGDPKKRGVVSTCSYEAREYGIHSAMSSATAFKLCPHGIFVYPRFKAYKEASLQIQKIFHEYTHLVEPLSLDEAFLDITHNNFSNPSATLIAKEIKQKILKKTQLTSSAGVSYNKFLAKIASDMNKPDGLTVIKPEQAENFIKKLPIGKFFGIGKKTEKRMLKIGIKIGADLRKFKKFELYELFGKSGDFFYNIVRGVDLREVNPYRERKSIGKENTFEKDLANIDEMLEYLETCAQNIENIMKKMDKKGKTITLKVKYDDFKSITRSITLAKPINEANVIMNNIKHLIKLTDVKNQKVRLLGIAISHLNENDTDNEKFTCSLF